MKTVVYVEKASLDELLVQLEADKKFLKKRGVDFVYELLVTPTRVIYKLEVNEKNSI